MFFRLRGVAELRQAEVQQLDAGLGDENIGGFQIAMSNALLVRGVESIANLAAYFSACFRGRGPFSGAPSTYSITR